MYRIKDSCSGCHTCELACPMGAVYYDGPRYQIDPDKCVGCGLCERLCPTCSIEDPDERRPAPAHERRVRSCDLVVCGGGTGIVTAVKAAQLGLKVVLLEKSRRLGGNTELAHGFFPVYSRLHAEKGVPDVREEAVEEFYRRAEGDIDKGLFRTAVYGCSEFFDWLLDFPGTRDCFRVELLGERRAIGPIFGPSVMAFQHRIKNRRSLDPSIGPGWMGSFVVETMKAAIDAQRLDVEILLEHEAKELRVDGSGRVCGVVAADPGGETEFRCRSVVLATGGFGSSDEKLDRYADFFAVERPVTRFSVPSDTGDAIDMLQKLGVRPDEERLYVSLFGPAHHPYSYSLYRVLEHPTSLSVDLNGRRWRDESGPFGGMKEIAGHPREAVWGIYSEKNIEDIMSEYLGDYTLSYEFDCYSCWREDLERESRYKTPAVVRGETIGELARKLSMEPSVLEKTVADYDRFCAQGCDGQFGKPPELLRPRGEGPYWAVYGQRFSECAMGGLRLDESCHVLREDGSPIPGLYGVGDATSAMHRRGKLAVVSELTWGMASAYRSAVNAFAEGGVRG